MLILGGSIFFQGISVNEHTSNDKLENNNVIETLGLIAVLAALGYASFLIIKLIAITLDISDVKQMHLQYNQNAKSIYYLQY